MVSGVHSVGLLAYSSGAGQFLTTFGVTIALAGIGADPGGIPTGGANGFGNPSTKRPSDGLSPCRRSRAV